MKFPAVEGFTGSPRFTKIHASQKRAPQSLQSTPSLVIYMIYLQNWHKPTKYSVDRILYLGGPTPTIQNLNLTTSLTAFIKPLLASLLVLCGPVAVWFEAGVGTLQGAFKPLKKIISKRARSKWFKPKTRLGYQGYQQNWE